MATGPPGIQDPACGVEMRNVVRFAILAALVCFHLAGQDASAQSVDKLSVEELLSTQVTSVGRKAQKLAQAPAAVFVLTQEDIRRSGATSLPEVLRLVPGLHVARLNGRTWAITARGANGQFSNKLLVMIDGRTVYTPFFSGVLWDQQDTILEDINRIEVIRGPGAAMWGANAVQGVINVITHRVAETQGTLISVTAGNQDHLITNVRAGFQLGDKTRLRVYGRQSLRHLFATGDEAFARVNLASTAGLRLGSVRPGWDGDLNMGRVGFRMDRTISPTVEWTLQGEGFRSYSDDMATDELRPGARLFRYDEKATGANLLTRWSKQKTPDDETMVQVWYDRSAVNAPLVAVRRDTVDVEFQRRRAISERQEIFWGLGGRWTTDATGDTPVLRFNPAGRTDSLWSLMARDEFQLVPAKLLLIGGGRLEHNNYSGWEFQPSLRLLYTPNARHSGWLAWSRAVHTPSRSDHDATITEKADYLGIGVTLLLTPNRQLLPERVYSYEAGYRWQTRRLSVDLTAFAMRTLGAYAFEPGRSVVDFGPPPRLTQEFISTNALEGWSRGGEIWGQWNVRSGWRIIPSYAFLRRELYALPGSRTVETRYQTKEDPEHYGTVRSLWEFSRSWQFDVTGMAVGSIGASNVPGYVRVDARLGWRPLRSHELSVTLQNLTDANRLEYLPDGLYMAMKQRRALVVRWAFRP